MPRIRCPSAAGALHRLLSYNVPVNSLKMATSHNYLSSTEVFHCWRCLCMHLVLYKKQMSVLVSCSFHLLITSPQLQQWCLAVSRAESGLHFRYSDTFDPGRAWCIGVRFIYQTRDVILKGCTFHYSQAMWRKSATAGPAVCVCRPALNTLVH